MNSGEIVKNLSGHSGCQVVLKKFDNRLCVVKSSATKEYNFRLKKQCKKQSKFVIKSQVYTPTILSCGYNKELFYYEMEYIQGRSLAEYTDKISIMEITNFIKCLFNSLYMDNATLDIHTQDIFQKKISSLENSLKNYKNLAQSFRILKAYNWSKVYKSPCHGDLTLENILISSDNKLYLIDFLDSFYNSWMMDIAKLLQDLDLKWAFRYKTLTQNMELRLLVAKEALLEEIEKTPDGFSKIITIYHILLLNLIRIYPYAKDKVTLEFLNSSTEYLNYKLEKMGATLCIH